MAVVPRNKQRAIPQSWLVPFDRSWAELVVSWVRDANEAYWLAPKTPPPLTSLSILRWRAPDHHRYLLMEDGCPEPVAYGELNRMTGGARRYWLGHLVVDGQRRGQGYGLQLTRLLLEEAFERRGARQVTLVVFPENKAALACYRAAGMRDDGWETHDFPAYTRRATLVRLVATRFP